MSLDADVDALHSVVTFRLGGQPFAVSAACVREVVPNAWLARPPRMPAFVMGVLNLGGVAVPVLRLDRILGLSDGTYGLEASILVMQSPKAPVGIMVEHVDGVQALADFEFLPIQEDRSLHGCVSGQLQGLLRQSSLLSWDAILLREERLRLEEFQQEVAGRLAELSEAGS